ncbi:hypothetical protein [Altericista sp. CCNU0014]|uniref:hypothetical protein n=1 Tax=Altericista sp. CCNU0014 TaxID=3082949 RepID=UPI00384AE851
MVQITIEVSDELAQRLEPFQDRLSQLFTRLISATLPGMTASELGLPVAAVEPPPTYQEVLDFLVSQPTSEQILGYKVSESAQLRLQTLLEKNREAALSASETSELDLYEQLDSLMAMLKIRAYASTYPKQDRLPSV